MAIKFDNTAIAQKNKESIKEQKKTEQKTSRIHPATSEKKETKPRDDGTYTYRPFEVLAKGSNSTK